MKDTVLELEWSILFLNGPVARDGFKSTVIFLQSMCLRTHMKSEVKETIRVWIYGNHKLFL